MSDKEVESSNRFVAEHLRLNAATAGSWIPYRSHRHRVTELVASTPTIRGGRLCVLGAGNCNDLDLRRLATIFDEIHLMDVDGLALRGGVRRQGFEGSDSVILHPGMDITGILNLLEEFGRGNAVESRVELLIEKALDLPALKEAASFQVVLSSSVLTQLILSVVTALGPHHPHTFALVLAVRRRHLKLMLQLLAAGGKGWLVGELVSSDTVPGLDSIPTEKLVGAAYQLVRERNFFTGANPFAIVQLLREDPELSPELTEVGIEDPWCWSLGSVRSYLAYAISMRRA